MRYNKKYIMKKILLSLSLISAIVSCSQPNVQESKQLIDWVDPQIGATHCRWFFYTPAALPFGMAKLAPTTDAYNSPGSWMPNGYDDRHTSIEGFAHLHEFQIGGIVTTPITGEVKTMPGTQENPDAGYRSRFDKATEIARAGSYEVVLSDYDVKVELTATERVGFHRYTYPKSDSSYILMDIGHPQGESAKVLDTHIEFDRESNSVSGFVECFPEYFINCDPNNKLRAYFYAEISKPIESVATFRDSIIYPSTSQIKGIGTGIVLGFATQEGEEVGMKVGLSYTSVEGAKRNFVAEATDKEFDQVRDDAYAIWNDKLSKIEVEGGLDSDKTKFYTGLYHALLGRGLASDIDGRYITNDKKIAQTTLGSNGKPLHHHYNTDGMWGGFWNLTQVWTLAYPEYFEDYVNSTLDFSRHTNGWLHDGQAAGGYTNGVLTNFQGLIACAAYNAGILKNTDIDYLWEVVYQNELGYKDRPFGSGRYTNEYFVNLGYVPALDIMLPNGWASDFGCSHTLEFSFSSYASASLAKSLGKTEEAAKLLEYAAGYKKLLDPETKYIRPKLEDGTFIKDFDPMKAWAGFQEGNAVQYTWYVPHDVKGMMNVVGVDLFNERLEKTFVEAKKTLYGGKPGEFDSFSGVEKLYNHGNQPCLHNSWLFNYAGKPWLTQYYTRDICNTFYGTEPTHGYGYGQDEDQGQLGAWYVMAAIGLFDVQGGTSTEPTMQIGSPLFDKVTIKLDPNYYSGKEFVIKAKDNGAANYYVNSAQLDGKPLNKCFISLSDITKGGELDLTMSPEPNKSWGIEMMPPSMSDQE